VDCAIALLIDHGGFASASLLSGVTIIPAQGHGNSPNGFIDFNALFLAGSRGNSRGVLPRGALLAV
jgi:hypothetical protein